MNESSIGDLCTILSIASITKAIVKTHIITIPVRAPITSALAYPKESESEAIN